MSLKVQTVGGGMVEASFLGLPPVQGVRIGEHEIPLSDFCAMATHFLSGGFFGWGSETPEVVNNALSNLFELYERVDGKWVRKAKYSLTI